MALRARKDQIERINTEDTQLAEAMLAEVLSLELAMAKAREAARV